MLLGVITVYVDGVQLLTYTDNGYLGAGSVGLFNTIGTSRYYSLWIQPVGDLVTGTPQYDVVTSTFIYTRQRLGSTQPTETPEIEDITTAGFNPQIGAGTIIPDAIYTSSNIASLIDDIAKQSNYSWYIDNNKYVNFQGQSILPAPWILQSTTMVIPVVDIEVDETLELDVSNDLYRNRQTILGAQDVIIASSTLAGDGKTRSFTLGYPLASAPSIFFNGIQQTVGLKGTTGFQWYYAVNDSVIEQDTSGNVLSSSDSLSIPDYEGIFVTSVVVNDTNAQAAMALLEGGTGIVENVEDHTNDVPALSIAAATTLATQLIARYAITGRTLIFNTTRPGLALGQMLTIFLPEHGIFDTAFQINQIEITLQKGVNDTQVWKYKITCSELPKQASWAKIIASGLTLKTLTA